MPTLRTYSNGDSIDVEADTAADVVAIYEAVSPPEITPEEVALAQALFGDVHFVSVPEPEPTPEPEPEPAEPWWDDYVDHFVGI